MFDSRKIFSAATHRIHSMKWDLEWIYFGDEKEVNWGFFHELLAHFIQDEKVILVRGRKNTVQLEKIEVPGYMISLLFQENFQIWNSDLSKVIVVNQIGTLRRGFKE